MHTACQAMGTSGEQCVCHEDLNDLTIEERQDFSSTRQALSLTSGDGLHYKCPLAGLRAPEMAAGGWKTALDHAFKMQEFHILQECFPMHEFQTKQLLDVFGMAKKMIAIQMTMKLSHWEHAPWSLAVLAHHDVCVARQGRRRLMATVDASSQNPSDHHPLTRLLLGLGEIRFQLELFGQGRPLAFLPLLAPHVQRLQFVPLSERHVEQQQSRLKKKDSCEWCRHLT